MSPDVITSFLTYYIRSLAERTRKEKTSVKFGFDWIIYNLALADDLTPHRLPFFRGGPTEISKTKTEAEFGIDASFLSADRQVLTLFVLKDEALCNSTWTANNFDTDLRNAAAPDLAPPEFKEVREVKIVLAYNKDEDQTGIQHFKNLTRALEGTIAGNVDLTFERWNLTTLVEKVRTKLLTPSLLPQSFFSQFAYICSQFGDFRHGSDEWTNQLVPNWRRFLDDLLKSNDIERSVHLIPVVLIILREHAGSNLSAETGWIDLAEWAMIALWQQSQTTPKAPIQKTVRQMWVNFYLAELERFYQKHATVLATEHSIATLEAGGYVDAVAAALIAFWHIGRLGIMSMSFSELLPAIEEGQKRAKHEALTQVANQLISILNANPAAKRPLLDLHHIELFLIWRALWQLDHNQYIYRWLHDLLFNLWARRSGTIPLPFIEGRNSIELVFEQVATGDKPPEFCDQSSFLVLCLLELCFSLEPARRNELLLLYYRQIVLGQRPDGQQMKNCQPIDLMGWSPPEDWPGKVLAKSLADEGESQTLDLFNVPPSADGGALADEIEAFVRQSRTLRKTGVPDGLWGSVIVLACLKHRSPLPAEFWRRSIFGPIQPTAPAEEDVSEAPAGHT
jgi:hypothetical protein